jgi:hypothetical protein
MDASYDSVQTMLLALAGDTPLIPRYIWPFLVALAAGAGFGFIGHKKRNAGLLWGISGALFGLVTAATAAGFANGITLPYTEAEMRHRQFGAFIFSVVVIGIVGAVSGLRAKSSPPLPPA